MESVKINNGMECPTIGIGTFMLSPADAENSVREALKMGYSLVDTANAHVNERAVGRGIRKSGVKREDVFLSTKLWPSEYENRMLNKGVRYYIRTDAQLRACRRISACAEQPMNLRLHPVHKARLKERQLPI